MREAPGKDQQHASCKYSRTAGGSLGIAIAKIKPENRAALWHCKV